MAQCGTERPSNISNKITSRIDYGASTGILSGLGSPEGVVTSDEGNLYLDKGSPTTGAWIKTNGLSNTDWLNLAVIVP